MDLETVKHAIECLVLVKRELQDLDKRIDNLASAPERTADKMISEMLAKQDCHNAAVYLNIALESLRSNIDYDINPNGKEPF